ncbi:MAG: ATP-binding protein [Verrucomicrobiota bacterium]|nr:ATP-binding protein [Verrucomicrobiota bacterium]
MKVQTKITILLIVVIATFLAGLWAFRSYDRRRFRNIAEKRYSELSQSFSDFLDHHGLPLQTMVEDYTCFDQLVQAIAAGDRQWLSEDISTEKLESFRANAVWVYRADGTRVYELNNIDNNGLSDVPVPREEFATLFGKQPLVHFFAKVPKGIMEIRGGTVHPSADFSRQTPARGYFFAGTLWNEPNLKEMAMYTGNEIAVRPDTSHAGENYNDEQNGLIAFSRTLSSWDGRPVAQLVVRNESPIVRELNRASQRQLVSLILFSLVLLLLLTTSLLLWVTRPLRRIMDSLRRNDAAPIEPMCQDTSEFGELARTTKKFFEQRDNLFREIEERRMTQEALRNSEEELRHSQKMEAVGRLAGGVAHDFNNLLTAIIGYAELISSRRGGDPQVSQQADLIRKAGEQAATLTRQLLAFSRKQLLQPRVIDLNELVVDMEKLLRRVIGERFDLRTLPEASIGRVMADPTQIEQVILNLGVNARDAMPTGGKLVIRTANVQLDKWQAPQISNSLKPGDYVELSVTDSGYGMDEETKAHIFEPFFTTKGPGKGTGLGLATVYGVVRQSGGGITVETHPGKGTTFRIYLPQETSPADLIKQPPEPMLKSQNFETVLVAEDEEIVRELVCDVLAEQGYNVMCACDGSDAIAKANKYNGKIHLLVTDVIMPNMNGQELALHLLALRPEMKVLYVSGYSDNDIGEHGVLDPTIDLLQKPFTPQTLARKIRDVIQENSYATVDQP